MYFVNRYVISKSNYFLILFSSHVSRTPLPKAFHLQLTTVPRQSFSMGGKNKKTKREEFSPQSSPQSAPTSPVDLEEAKSNPLYIALSTLLKKLNDDLKQTVLGRVKTVEDRLDNLEAEMKKKNLVIYGIVEEASETPKLTEEKVSSFLRKNLRIAEADQFVDDCFRLGKPNQNNKNCRPILLQLTREKFRRVIFSNVKFLRGTKFKISSDLSPEGRKKKSLLLLKRREALSTGKNVKMTDTWLMVDGVKYIVDSNGTVVPKP